MTRLISREHIRCYNTARCLPVVRFGIFDVYSGRANRARCSESPLWRHYAHRAPRRWERSKRAATSRGSTSPRIASRNIYLKN